MNARSANGSVLRQSASAQLLPQDHYPQPKTPQSLYRVQGTEQQHHNMQSAPQLP